MNRKIWRVALMLILLPTAAAGDELEAPELDRYLRWGGLRVRPGLKVSDVGYDDNIFLSNDDSKTGDYTATVTPKLDGLILLGGRTFLTFLGQVDRTVYLDTSELNYTNYRARARYTVPFKRSGVYGRYDYSDVLVRPIDLEDQRMKVRTSDVALGLILRPSWRTEVKIEHSLRDIANRDPDDPTIPLRLDRSENSTDVRLSYRAWGRTQLRLRGGFGSIDFDNDYPIPGTGLVVRNSSERRLTAGAEFGSGGPLTGTFEIGWGVIDAEDPVSPDFADVIGAATLVYRLGDRTRLRMDGERMPGFSVYRGSVYYLDTNFGLRVVYFLTRLIGVEAGGKRGVLTFPGAADVVEREDLLRRYDVGLRFRPYQNSIDRRVEYSFRVGRYRRVSTVESLNRSRWTVGLNAVLGF